jgi:hypothetical protein
MGRWALATQNQGRIRILKCDQGGDYLYCGDKYIGGYDESGRSELQARVETARQSFAKTQPSSSGTTRKTIDLPHHPTTSLSQRATETDDIRHGSAIARTVHSQAAMAEEVDGSVRKLVRQCRGLPKSWVEVKSPDETEVDL